MPRLLSSVNGSSQVGISSDGTSLGNMTRLNYESNRVKLDTTATITIRNYSWIVKTFKHQEEWRINTKEMTAKSERI